MLVHLRPGKSVPPLSRRGAVHPVPRLTLLSLEDRAVPSGGRGGDHFAEVLRGDVTTAHHSESVDLTQPAAEPERATPAADPALQDAAEPPAEVRGGGGGSGGPGYPVIPSAATALRGDALAPNTQAAAPVSTTASTFAVSPVLLASAPAAPTAAVATAAATPLASPSGTQPTPAVGVASATPVSLATTPVDATPPAANPTPPAVAVRISTPSNLTATGVAKVTPVSLTTPTADVTSQTYPPATSTLPVMAIVAAPTPTPAAVSVATVTPVSLPSTAANATLGTLPTAASPAAKPAADPQPAATGVQISATLTPEPTLRASALGQSVRAVVNDAVRFTISTSVVTTTPPLDSVRPAVASSTDAASLPTGRRVLTGGAVVAASGATRSADSPLRFAGQTPDESDPATAPVSSTSERAATAPRRSAVTPFVAAPGSATVGRLDVTPAPRPVLVPSADADGEPAEDGEWVLHGSDVVTPERESAGRFDWAVVLTAGLLTTGVYLVGDERKRSVLAAGVAPTLPRS